MSGTYFYNPFGATNEGGLCLPERSAPPVKIGPQPPNDGCVEPSTQHTVVAQHADFPALEAIGEVTPRHCGRAAADSSGRGAQAPCVRPT